MHWTIKQIKKSIEEELDIIWGYTTEEGEKQVLNFTIEYLIDKYGSEKVKKCIDNRVK